MSAKDVDIFVQFLLSAGTDMSAALIESKQQQRTYSLHPNVNAWNRIALFTTGTL